MGDMPRRPRGFHDKEKFCQDRLLEFIEGRRRRLGKNQAELGAALGITQQAYGQHANPQKGKGNFTFIQLVKLFKELEVTDEEILTLMKM